MGEGRKIIDNLECFIRSAEGIADKTELNLAAESKMLAELIPMCIVS